MNSPMMFYAMTFAETQDLQDPIKKETLIDNLDKNMLGREFLGE
jgi:hypothetical protein